MVPTDLYRTPTDTLDTVWKLARQNFSPQGSSLKGVTAVHDSILSGFWRSMRAEAGRSPGKRRTNYPVIPGHDLGSYRMRNGGKSVFLAKGTACPKQRGKRTHLFGKEE